MRIESFRFSSRSMELLIDRRCSSRFKASPAEVEAGEAKITIPLSPPLPFSAKPFGI